VTSKWTAGRNWSQRLERIVFVDLLVTAMGATLAFGTVEPWSLALFQLNALVVGGILVVLAAFDPAFAWSRQWLALPLWGRLLWAICQILPLTGEVSAIGAPPPEGLSMEQLRLATISEAPHLTRAAVFKLFAFSLYFSAALQVLRTSSRRRLTVQVLAGFGLMVACLAILQRLTSPRTLYWIRPVSAFVAPFGPYGNYNHFAGLIELLFPLPLAWLIFSRCRLDERIFHGVAVTLMVTAAVLSMSRAGILSIGIQLLAFGFLMVMNRRRSALPLVILVAVILLSLWIGYEPLQRRLSSFSSGASEHSVVTRLSYWKSSWRIFLDHPLTGVGLGAFPTVYPSYGSSSSRYERLEQAHNDYLQLLTDTGVVGGVLMGIAGIFIVRTWFRLIRRLSMRKGALVANFFGSAVALLGILVHSLFDFNLQITANALLALLMLAISVSSGPDTG